jgi:hypothetical protein
MIAPVCGDSSGSSHRRLRRFAITSIDCSALSLKIYVLILSFLCPLWFRAACRPFIQKILCSSASSAESAKVIAPISVLICLQRGGRSGSTAQIPQSLRWLSRGDKIRAFVMLSGVPELSYLSYLADLILDPLIQMTACCTHDWESFYRIASLRV